MENIEQAAETPVTEAPATIEQTMADVFDKHNPQEQVGRSDNGQFQSKAEPESKAVEAPQEAAPAETVTQDAPAVDPEPAKPVIGKPQAWAAEKAEMWAKLSPEAQEYIAQREGEAQRRMSQLGETESAVKKLNAVMEPYRGFLGNVAPDVALANYLQADRLLRESPQQAIQWLAQQYGIDLSRFAQSGEPAPESDTALTRELQSLRRELYETKNQIAAREQRESDSRVQSLEAQIKEFAGKNEHWTDVESEVTVQSLAIRAAHPEKDPLDILKEAYDRAVKLNDTVQAKITKAKREKEEAEKTAEAKRKAEEAKKHASLDVKSRASAPKAAFKSFEAQMAEVYDQVSARG